MLRTWPLSAAESDSCSRLPRPLRPPKPPVKNRVGGILTGRELSEVIPPRLDAANRIRLAQKLHKPEPYQSKKLRGTGVQVCAKSCVQCVFRNHFSRECFSDLHSGDVSRLALSTAQPPLRAKQNPESGIKNPRKRRIEKGSTSGRRNAVIARDSRSSGYRLPGGGSRSVHFLSGSSFFTYSIHSFWSSSMLASPKPAW
jgi:hypothetical protein